MAQAVEALALELRVHHAPTADHSHRLAAHARVVAENLRLDALDATEVELVAVLHDVGKLAVDPHILDWPGPLDDPSASACAATRSRARRCWRDRRAGAPGARGARHARGVGRLRLSRRPEPATRSR